jgi:hypothetical protein
MPEVGIATASSFGNADRGSTAHSTTSSARSDTGEHTEPEENGALEDLQPKASFYEKLRRAGSRKAKPRK